MPSRSVGGARLPPPRRPGPLSARRPEDPFAAAPATTVDLRAPGGDLWKRALLDDGLRPADAPTRESRDVIESLAAHEFSIARARREVVAAEEPRTNPALSFEAGQVIEEWDLSALEAAAPSAVEEDLAQRLPTRIRTPAPPVTLVERDRSPVMIMACERLPHWPLTPTPTARRTSARRDTGAIWRVLLVSGALVCVGLGLLVIRSRNLVPRELPASLEPVPRAAVPVDSPPALPEVSPAPAPVITPSVAERRWKRRVAARKSRPAPVVARETAPGAEPGPATPAALDQARPNPF
jgi:hypothetical protein